ncbi:hypothetical protein GCM10020001_087730 [Nonomuraea salmonea]
MLPQRRHCSGGGAGATFEDVTKLTVYVAGWSPEQMPLFMEGVSRAMAGLGG